ncbi:Het-C-domain-containing protein [Auriscalpium vulgare]|uniref:Het-C-domain-containing protein n=1 Tax=Auriscalpium vulgare TaxID=40419 RepID=A0ACB8S5H8_9AGAM|nr:Het-C-domain-containing protein [Auriscalpium vulgare]
MAANWTLCFAILVVLVVCLPGNEVLAFGAGNIPSFAYLEGRAFRHGDIEDALSELAKKSGGFALGALIGKGGSKFGGLDIKRVYFGNWLRDYSQAVDIAGLKKLDFQTILNLCMALGFLANGYATAEFEVTKERLGVYLPTEHIDNPKGYGEGEDARRYDPRLRGPVDPRELEVDPRSGMKNYIANENGNWDTSKALVRRTIEKCIHLGRQHRSQGRKEDEYEAYRLLGQALHTLEDFAAHSNFCELALVSLGHQNVFVHVGDSARVQAPNGKWVAPLVTGTFGGSDFLYSLLGEATDHISEASVTDLNKAIDSAKTRSRGGGLTPADTLRDLLFKLPGGSSSEMSRDLEGIERIRDAPAQGGKPPEQMSPQELHAVLWQVLSFRDGIVKKIEQTIEKIPGLGPLIEKLMDSISVFVFTTLEPFLKPILSTASSQLSTASSEVINKHDQYEVFNDPRADDPTHSFLSKDHFDLILNEPAGNLAKIVVKYSVSRIAKAWDDTSVNVHNLAEDILQCLFHPDFHHSGSEIQREMMQYMRHWVQSLGNKQNEIINRLSKESVRTHKNVRLGGEGGPAAAEGSWAQNAGHQAQAGIGGYLHGIPGVSQAQGLMNTFSGGPKRDGSSSYGGPAYGGMPAAGAPPIVQAATRPSGGQSADYYGEGAKPAPPPPNVHSYPGGSPAPNAYPAAAPPAHGHHAHGHGHGHGHHGGVHGGGPPAIPDETSYGGMPGAGAPSFPGSSASQYPAEPSYGHAQSSYPGQAFPGQAQSSFPGQSSYPGQPQPQYHGTPPSMPGANDGYAPPYGMPGGGPPGGYGAPGGPSSYGPPGGFGFPDAGQGQGQPGFPDAQHQPGGYGGYQY